MTSVTKGNFSISGISTAKIGGNVLETTHTGSGTGFTGNATFQAVVLTAIESIIRNRHDPDYDLPPILLLADQPTMGQNFPLSLFVVPEEITQSQIPSATLLQSFLLKDDSLTQGSTTQITDTATVKLMEYIATNVFSTIQKAIKMITEDEEIEIDFSESGDNGRYKTSIVNSIFSLHITIQ